MMPPVLARRLRRVEGRKGGTEGEAADDATSKPPSRAAPNSEVLKGRNNSAQGKLGTSAALGSDPEDEFALKGQQQVTSAKENEVGKEEQEFLTANDANDAKAAGEGQGKIIEGKMISGIGSEGSVLPEGSEGREGGKEEGEFLTANHAKKN